MARQPYDLIGDIHGHHDKLVAILKTLGYRPRGAFSGWSHPEGRKVIFLGDYIDRGPAVREVLREVRGLVEAGDALAIMGNHEYNAILFHLPDGDGGHLRPRNEKNLRQHAATLEAFAGRDEEWAGWIEWMKQLPMFLDLADLRAVHASWDAYQIAWLRRLDLASEAFFRASAVKGSRAHRAVENILKGPELALPEEMTYRDKEGVPRRSLRVRWWDLPEGNAPAGDLALPEPTDLPVEIPAREIRRLPQYAPGEVPVFFGHYWLPRHRHKAPLAPNLASLDYSAGIGDAPLVAYRWDGERVLQEEKFIHVQP